MSLVDLVIEAELSKASWVVDVTHVMCRYDILCVGIGGEEATESV